jgi:hypothetical protein
MTLARLGTGRQRPVTEPHVRGGVVTRHGWFPSCARRIARQGRCRDEMPVPASIQMVVMPARAHLPAGWHAFGAIGGVDRMARRARTLLHRIHVTLFSRSTGRVADIVGRVFNRFAAVIIGVVLMVIGLGMMATIVMLPVGVVLELAGVLIFVGGFFAPDDRAVRQGGER